MARKVVSRQSLGAMEKADHAAILDDKSWSQFRVSYDPWYFPEDCRYTYLEQIKGNKDSRFISHSSLSWGPGLSHAQAFDLLNLHQYLNTKDLSVNVSQRRFEYSWTLPDSSGFGWCLFLIPGIKKIQSFQEENNCPLSLREVDRHDGHWLLIINVIMRIFKDGNCDRVSNR